MSALGRTMPITLPVECPLSLPIARYCHSASSQLRSWLICAHYRRLSHTALLLQSGRRAGARSRLFWVDLRRSALRQRDQKPDIRLSARYGRKRTGGFAQSKCLRMTDRCSGPDPGPSNRRARTWASGPRERGSAGCRAAFRLGGGKAIVLDDRQRNGRVEDVIGIVLALGLDEPFDVAAIAFRGAFRVASGEEVGYPPESAVALKASRAPRAQW